MNSTYAASKLCRACLSDHEDMQDIFQTCFAGVFEYCTSLQICVNDGLPSALCRNCVGLLNTSYYFKQQCIRSDETLKQIIVAPQINDGRKEDSSFDLKYDVCAEPSIVDVEFPVDDKYSQSIVLEVEALSKISTDNSFVQKLQEDKEMPPIEESAIGDDMKCNYNPDDLKCDNNYQEEVLCKDAIVTSTQQPTAIETITETPPLTTPVQENLLIKETKKKPSKGFIKCPKCGKIFKTPHRLDAHIREHYGLKPFVCRICQKELSNWRTYKMHTNKHNGKRNYVCTVCKKSFTYPTALEVHKKIHLGVRNYTCTKCDASFVQSAHLKTHMSIHSSNQPYACSQCNKSFKTNANFKSHLERHKGVKNYVCSICGKPFPTNGELTAHMRSHNKEKKFHCEQCSKSYKRKSLLTQHLRTHTGDLPFKCTVCCKRFRDSQVLKRHYVTHSDIKSHVCPFCHKCFVHKSSLNKHSKTHNKQLQGIVFEFIDESLVKDSL